MGTIDVSIVRCKGCEYCVKFCPKKIMTMSSSTGSMGYHYAVLMDEAKCNGCAICAMACPDLAIEVWR